MTHPERIVPDETSGGILALHLKRYDFARPLCAGKRVLDAACGVGYGTAYLAEVAAEVVGVDLDAETVEYARARYGSPTVTFAVGDVTALDFPLASFEVVCSFETVEHVPEPERAIAEAARVVADDGVYILSTPCVAVTDRAPANPFHMVELSAQDLEHALRASFMDVELFGQRRVETRRHRLLRKLDVLGLRRRLPARASAGVTGSAGTSELTLSDIEIDASLKRADVVLAVCRRPRR